MARLLVFSFIAFAIYYLIPWRFRRLFLLVVSVAFYAMIDWKMLALLVLSALWTWCIAMKISDKRTSRKSQPSSRSHIIIAILPLIFVLVFFKINRFFVAEAGQFLNNLEIGTSVQTLALLMPVGLSYYIFKAISYVIDVNRGKYAAESSLLNVALYILFFPEIQSGPISRYDIFAESMSKGMRYKDESFRRGIYLIIKGVFLKTVIANRLSPYTDQIFMNPNSYTGVALWLNAFLFAVQLYCDFSGYSSIAIGITQILGMHIQNNFQRPYFATSISDFWDRWHISLSTWFRDYVYFPLGGSKKGKLRTKFNVLLVFLISGIWHGDGLQFIVWGAYHGIMRIFSPRRRTGVKHRVLHTLITFIIVSFGWIIFRSNSVNLAIQYIIRMFATFSFSISAIQSAILPFTGDNTCIAFFITIMAFILIYFIREVYEERKRLGTEHIASIPWQVFLLASIILFGNLRISSFIYANF